MSWKTWLPFRSHEVKSICEHFTKAERRVVYIRGMLTGLWGALCLAPGAWALESSSVAMLLLVPAGFIVFGASIPLLQRS